MNAVSQMNYIQDFYGLSHIIVHRDVLYNATRCLLSGDYSVYDSLGDCTFTSSDVRRSSNQGM